MFDANTDTIKLDLLAYLFNNVTLYFVVHILSFPYRHTVANIRNPFTDSGFEWNFVTVAGLATDLKQI